MVDAKAAAYPREEAVDGSDEGQDGEHVAQNLACDDEAEHGALGKGVQSVHRRVHLFLAPVDDDASARHGLLQLWGTDLADRDRRRNTHDRGGDQILSWNAHADVSAQDGARDGRESLNGFKH